MLRRIINKGRRALKVFFSHEENLTSIFRPYRISPKLGDIQIDFMIADSESASWYDHAYNPLPPELVLLQAMTKPNFHVLEIGVHNGFHAAMFTQLLDERFGRYHGIELMPSCYLNALAQLKLNNAGPGFQLTNAAAGDSEGTVGYADIFSGNGSIDSSGKGVSINQIRGDSLLPSLEQRIDLLKIDVEGYEAFVLEGCQDILKQRPSIALELHFSAWPNYRSNLDQVLKHIDVAAYHAVFFCNPNSGNLYGLSEPERIRYFDPAALPRVDNMNVFFFSKRQFETLPIEAFDPDK